MALMASPMLVGLWVVASENFDTKRNRAILKTIGWVILTFGVAIAFAILFAMYPRP
jgi:hypothetical protein